METPSQDTENLQPSMDFFVDVGSVKREFFVNKTFKLHLLLASGISIGCFLIWVFVDFFAHHWPWFIYPTTFFALTITFHFYLFIRPKEILSLHFAWYLIVNLMMFLTWIFSQSKVPWFLFVIFGWGLALVTHYILVMYRNHPSRNLYIHLAWYGVINGLCFFVWIIFPTIAWFVWPLFGMGALVAAHWSLHYHPGNFFRLHVLVFIDIQLLLFFTWVVTGMPFPWWTFPLAVWGFILVGHAYFTRNDSHHSAHHSPTQVNPSAPPLGDSYLPPPEETPINNNNNTTSYVLPQGLSHIPESEIDTFAGQERQPQV